MVKRKKVVINTKTNLGIRLNGNGIRCFNCLCCDIANNGIFDGISFNEDFYPKKCEKFFKFKTNR